MKKVVVAVLLSLAGTGVFDLIAAGGRDIFVSKLDPSGNFLLAKSMGGLGDDYGRSIDTDVSGNLFALASSGLIRTARLTFRTTRLASRTLIRPVSICLKS